MLNCGTCKRKYHKKFNDFSIFTFFIPFSQRNLAEFTNGRVLFLCHNFGKGGRKMYVYVNPNPRGQLIGDCAVRALSIALGTSWDETYLALTEYGFRLKNLPNADSVWGELLRDNGFTRRAIPDTPRMDIITILCLMPGAEMSRGIAWDDTQARAGFQAKGMGGTDANKKGFRDSGKGIGAISTDLSDLQQAGRLVYDTRPPKKSRVIL
jgi:hypothetical protein